MTQHIVENLKYTLEIRNKKLKFI